MTDSITKIALVDDHSLLRSSLATLVASFEGYTVAFEADNGKQFIEKLKEHDSPDIILLDITMPEMNGFETAAWIKQNLPNSKILVLSMMDSDSAIITMIKEGARGYIFKDSKPSVFRQALNDIRDRGFFLNELVSTKMLNFVMDVSKKKHSGLINQLSEKELIFIKLACSELTYKEIANKLGLSTRTVEGYRDEIFKKLNVTTRVGLVMFAVKNGICTL
jgi:DNA-binding NarL/FixJ family response regulator